MHQEDWNPAERAILKRLSTPTRIQAFLDSITYNKAPGGISCRSPRQVLRDRTAHCLEGALLGAAALDFHGFKPFLLDLKAVRDVDHVLALYRVDGHWGALGKSNYASLRFREPVYRTIRELVMSYFEHYHNLRGEKTLRAYSRPVGLSQFNGWRTAANVWPIAEHLCTVPHTSILTRAMEWRLNRLDARLRRSEQVGRG